MHQDVMRTTVSASAASTEDSVTKAIEAYTAESLRVGFWVSPWARWASRCSGSLAGGASGATSSPSGYRLF
jgi:hypothetical protein